jgi:hypothetical protein
MVQNCAIVEYSNILLCPRLHGGIPAISGEPQTSTQAWKLIEVDYSLRLYLVADDWATKHLRAWNEVFAEGRKRGNAAYCGPALVEMEIADADKRAEWAYQTCCEIWEIQGRAKCRPFFRAIFDSCLQPMFSVRESCFKHELELHQKRTRTGIPQGLSAIGGHMNRKMGKLRAKWNTKLEIAARDLENQARVEQQRALEEKSRAILELRERGFFEQAFGQRQPSFLPSVSKRNTRKSRMQLKRMSVIFGAIQSGLKGTKYCAALDGRKLLLPDHWSDEGCPDTYVQAYRDARWRKRIQDEKCRYRQQYEKTPAHEREAIVQGQSGTRHTRQGRVKVPRAGPA